MWFYDNHFENNIRKNFILLMYLGIIKRCEKFQFSKSNHSGDKLFSNQNKSFACGGGES